MAIMKKATVSAGLKGMAGRVKAQGDCHCWSRDHYTCGMWKKTCDNAENLKRLVGRVQSPLSKKSSRGK